LVDDEEEDEDEVVVVVGKKRPLAEVSAAAAAAPKPLSYLDVARDSMNARPVDTIHSANIRPKYTNYKMHDWSDEEYWEARDNILS
jgi:hypothetical protein